MISQGKNNLTRSDLRKRVREIEGKAAPIMQARKPERLSLGEIKDAARNKLLRGGEIFHSEDIIKFVTEEVTRQDGGESVITRGVIKMTDQAMLADEILEKSNAIVETQLAKFRTTCDTAIDETKKRVSQLNDYNNRLTTAVTNLNKTLADERMVVAMNNAEKLVTALALLDKLEASGSLERIVAALNSGSAAKK